MPYSYDDMIFARLDNITCVGSLFETSSGSNWVSASGPLRECSALDFDRLPTGHWRQLPQKCLVGFSLRSAQRGFCATF